MALRDTLATRLPEVMLPAAYVRLDALPLTANGKLDRRALPAPGADALAAQAYAAPEGERETLLAALWSELLEVEQIGRNDNFFALGGHSLLAISLIEYLRQRGWQLDVPALFTHPTLLHMAAQLHAGQVAVPHNRIGAGCTRITPELLPLLELDQAEIDAIATAVNAGAANIQDIYPLAPLQEGMLFHHLANASADAYLQTSLMAFDTRDRLDRFLAALTWVVARHDILRTGFVWNALRKPVQVVWRHAPPHLHEHALDDDDVAAALQAMLASARYRIDLQQAPLLHAHIAYDHRHARWLLNLAYHHLVLDHTTLQIAMEEIDAHLSERTHALPPALPFRNFIFETGTKVAEVGHERFFTKTLGDVDGTTAPFGLSDVNGDGSRLRSLQLAVPDTSATVIRQHARQLGISPAAIFHLAYALVLAVTSGRDDVVFGTVLFGRMNGGAGADRAMGMFLNTLPLRLRRDATPLAQALRQTHARLAELVHHEHAPLALAQRCSALGASTPLFCALLNYRYSTTPDSALDGQQAGAFWDGVQGLHKRDVNNYPLTLSVNDGGKDFTLDIKLDHSVPAERVGALMLHSLAQMLHALAQRPDAPLHALPILPAAERQSLPHVASAASAPDLPARCIHAAFQLQARRTPHATALICGEQSLSYAQLDQQAEQLATELHALGAGPSTRVAIYLTRSVGMVVAWLATLKSGAAYVPLDPAYPADRLAYMLDDCRPRAVLTCAALEGQLPACRAMRTARVLTLDAQQRNESAPSPPVALPTVAASELAYVIYTSGSSGRPKGVMIEHRQLDNLVRWHGERFGLQAGEHCTAVAGLSFDAAAWEIWPALCHGVCVRLAPAAASADPSALLAWWSAQQAQLSFLPTPLAEIALQQRQWPSDLRVLLTGGDRLGAVRQALPFDLVNNYGLTETAVVATSGRVAVGAGLPSIGTPIDRLCAHVLDRWGHLVPIGAIGELHLAGASLARGYLGRPALTAERFVPDPFAAHPGQRMYRTGDLVRWTQAHTLDFVGRNDQQVKVRGVRVEPGEIEAVLRNAAGVREVAVIARQNQAGNSLLVAYVTGQQLAIDALRAHAIAQLPDAMVPAGYVHLDALPLTPNGKLDRNALPAPDDQAFGVQPYAPPQGPVEERLADLWRDLLGVERIGRYDNFFDLGGHSLLAVQLASRVRTQLHAEMPLDRFFANPQLHELAQQVLASRLQRRAQTDADTLLARAKTGA
ncbi:non-ribosomal peptide synthetase [Xanthomonas graminis]|uniref:Arthrofactin synthetase/syringopeptin synthetase C-related non-ribosomal peptide synthetase n=1 Tax=Xanthomonas graminis pv. arrhenatheri LMG 727 TaxID=1195923 RepID=A0A0K2ZJ36_9XANT|nr:non-ribosomal peptide synthetase [Xanthomonas translucens]CTP83390.1 arthrofactin synthetase/syringopeptin synthetase C-related non-ribosomal peptide synthetase [Xanthomonas translucens pv. arrhenatheri LMG 727]